MKKETRVAFDFIRSHTSLECTDSDKILRLLAYMKRFGQPAVLGLAGFILHVTQRRKSTDELANKIIDATVDKELIKADRKMPTYIISTSYISYWKNQQTKL